MTTPYRILTTDDAKDWQEVLPDEACIMGSLAYARIQECQFGQTARLFVACRASSRVVYPFYLQPVPNHAPFARGDRWDTATPEYTGPLVLGEAAEDRALRPEWFRAAFDEYCQSTGIVAEFAHLNPWNRGAALLPPSGAEVNRELVYIDLTLDEDTLWKQSLSSDTRRMLRQAGEAGVRTFPAETLQDVLAFHRLHQLTMERRAASERYCLPPEYFVSIFETMRRNSLFMLAEYQGRIVAGGLYFLDAAHVYWHLSAVDLEFARVRPADAYHYAAIKLAARAGKQHMLCGGAFRTGDGVFRFKAGFSPLRVPFKVFKRIHDPVAYAALAVDWARRHPGLLPEPGFFPSYRSAALASAPSWDSAPLAETS